MSEKIDEVYALPAINLLDIIDGKIQAVIDRDITGTMQRVFNYYNSVVKPLSHREFIQFWSSLSEAEMAKYYEHFFR